MQKGAATFSYTPPAEERKRRCISLPAIRVYGKAADPRHEIYRGTPEAAHVPGTNALSTFRRHRLALQNAPSLRTASRWSRERALPSLGHRKRWSNCIARPPGLFARRVVVWPARSCRDIGCDTHGPEDRYVRSDRNLEGLTPTNLRDMRAKWLGFWKPPSSPTLMTLCPGVTEPLFGEFDLLQQNAAMGTPGPSAMCGRDRL
jgi:hypothetical protein